MNITLPYAVIEYVKLVGKCGMLANSGIIACNKKINLQIKSNTDWSVSFKNGILQQKKNGILHGTRMRLTGALEDSCYLMDDVVMP